MPRPVTSSPVWLTHLLTYMLLTCTCTQAKASASSTAGAQGVGESACAVDLAAVETFGVALARHVQRESHLGLT